MIHDVKELSASLQYVSVWADKLEGLRQHSAATEAGLLATTARGPLAEMRRVLTEAREFVDSLAEESSAEAPGDHRLPVSERQQAA